MKIISRAVLNWQLFLPILRKMDTNGKLRLLKLVWKIDSRLEPILFDAQSFEKNNWIPLVYEIKKHGIPIEFAARLSIDSLIKFINHF